MKLGDRWEETYGDYLSVFEARLCPGPFHEPDTCDEVTAVQINSVNEPTFTRCDSCAQRHKNRKTKERKKRAKLKKQAAAAGKKYAPIPVKHPGSSKRKLSKAHNPIDLDVVTELLAERSYRKGFGYGSFREFHPTKH